MRSAAGTNLRIAPFKADHPRGNRPRRSAKYDHEPRFALRSSFERNHRRKNLDDVKKWRTLGSSPCSRVKLRLYAAQYYLHVEAFRALADSRSVREPFAAARSRQSRRSGAFRRAMYEDVAGLCGRRSAEKHYGRSLLFLVCGVYSKPT
jgi:hypothetical protein